jgi:undecaprenyl-diphosphatase
MITNISAWDASIAHVVEAGRTPILTDFFSLITQLGDARWIIVVALSLAFVLWRHKRLAYKIGFAVALFGSVCSSYLIKVSVARPRPPFAERLITEGGYSFPSMHAAVSLAVFGFLAYVAYKILRPHHHRMPLAIGLGILALVIGFSRIYLGVHYASDVIAGYVLGILFIYLGVRATRYFESTRTSGRGA